MGKKRNTKPMEEYNHKRGYETRERVIHAINECTEKGNISTTAVCKLAGVSRTYFTNHRDMRKMLDDAMKVTNRALKKKKQSENDKDALNRMLYVENTRLKKEIQKLEKVETYKEKYDKKCLEVEKLKKELEESNKLCGLLNF